MLVKGEPGRYPQPYITGVSMEKVAALKYNQYCDVIMGAMVSQPHDCLLNCLFRHRKRKTSKKTSKLRLTGLYEGTGTNELKKISVKFYIC